MVETKKFIKQVTGALLYYACIIDNTILTVLSAIVAEQAASTQQKLRNTKQLLVFAATQGETLVTYKASNKLLVIHSDASYVSEPKAKS